MRIPRVALGLVEDRLLGQVVGAVGRRDVGADLQELYLGQGASRVWSSDTCSTVQGSEVRAFPPNGEREYNVTWNGKQANKCTAGLAAGTAPAAGQYEMRFRLGAKISAPVVITITA